MLLDYIVDFCCPKANLIIELDGGQHFSPKGIEKDKLRDKELTKQGYKILRFSDRQIFENIDGIIGKIYDSVIPLRPPLGKGDRKKDKE